MSHSNCTKILAGHHIVGEVCGGVFRKRICGSKHLLRTPRAIAFDLESLDQAEQAGAERVEVYDTETGTTYRATITHIRAKGFTFNRGFGEQIALVMDGWTRQRRGDFVQLSMLEMAR